MRVTVATVFLAATAALATPHNAPSHDAVAKRLRERALEMRDLAIKFGRGEHDIDEVPDGLEYPGEPDEENFFASGPEEEEEDYTSGNGTSAVVTEREVLEAAEVAERGTTNKKPIIAWTNEVPKAWGTIAKAKPFGLYTWTEWRPVECDKYKIPFFPMLKGDKKRDSWKQKVNKKGYADKYILAMNEVNIQSESPMGPDHAAWLINTYMVPVANKFNLTIVSPSFANGKTTIPWLQKFKKTQPKLWNRMPVLALHYYGTSSGPVIKYLTDVHNAFPEKKIWVTELGCQSYTSKPQCSTSQANAYLKELLNWSNKQPWLEHIAWYSTFVNSRVGMGKPNAMFKDKNGSLTAFGKSLLSL